MDLVWATTDLVIAGRPYAGFPILLWDTMASCRPVNLFFRAYLLRGSIGSIKSWPVIGRALYDYFSFLQAHELDWKDVERGDAKSLVAAYRDYCLTECKLARSTTCQRLLYVCKFYEFSLKTNWITNLPFGYEERNVARNSSFFAHLYSGTTSKANDIMPRRHQTLPKFLNRQQIRCLLQKADNPHHRMIIRLALQTGLRREEIATFPIQYIFDPDDLNPNERNIRIYLDPYDGYGILTKGSKPRHIYISRRFLSELNTYKLKIRGERASLSTNDENQLFLNKFGRPFAQDGKKIEGIVRDIGKKAGIKLHPHMLRHTYATHTLSALQNTHGSIDPLVFVQRQLGHASIHTTMIYLHLINELADNAVFTYDDELSDDEGEI
jgi:site-specific recombinase XerD